MTLQELHAKLKNLGISEDNYYLHGLYGSITDDDKLAISIRKGAHSIEYEVYVKERGERHSLRTFAKEEEACQYVYNRFKESKEIEDKYSNKTIKRDIL